MSNTLNGVKIFLKVHILLRTFVYVGYNSITRRLDLDAAAQLTRYQPSHYIVHCG